MTIINHECYISLEVAKLLKEAGFDWKQYSFYNSKGILMNGAFTANWNNICYMDGGYGSQVSAPTIEVAQRWLREVKGCYVFAKPIFSANRKLLYYLSDVVYDKDYTLFAEFSTYERAQEAGIKKALEIILEKGE